MVQVDDFGNISSIVTVNVTVAAAGITPTVLGRNFTGNNANTTLSIDMTAHDGVEQVVVMLGALMSGSPPIEVGGTAITLDGETPTAVLRTATSGSNGPSLAYAVFAGKAYPSSATLSATGATTFGMGAQAYGVPADATIALLDTAQPQTTRTGSSFTGTITAGDAVIVGQQVANGTSGATASAGLTIDYEQDIRASNEWFVAASGGELSAGSFTATISDSGNTATSAIALRIS